MLRTPARLLAQEPRQSNSAIRRRCSWLQGYSCTFEMRRSIGRRADGVQVRVIAESQPAAAAMFVPPALEDAYLACLSAHRCGATG